MPDHYQYTRAGYQVVDPDDAPTPEEQFCEYLAWIWKEASTQERIAIVHERYALGIKSKAIRELTATEQAVIDAEIAYQMNQVEWEAELDRRNAELEEAYYAAMCNDDIDEVSSVFDEWDDNLPF